jgi:NADP-dependent 3-hydroxy acid dehydrogenase YdfG
MGNKKKLLRDQVVVVFGASSGIGRITALRFAQSGAKVVVSARSEEGLSSLVREIEAVRPHRHLGPGGRRGYLRSI